MSDYVEIKKIKVDGNDKYVGDAYAIKTNIPKEEIISFVKDFITFTQSEIYLSTLEEAKSIFSKIGING